MIAVVARQTGVVEQILIVSQHFPEKVDSFGRQ
jgi:hypothetical protein